MQHWLCQLFSVSAVQKYLKIKLNFFETPSFKWRWEVTRRSSPRQVCKQPTWLCVSRSSVIYQISGISNKSNSSNLVLLCDSAPLCPKATTDLLRRRIPFSLMRLQIITLSAHFPGTSFFANSSVFLCCVQFQRFHCWKHHIISQFISHTRSAIHCVIYK